MVLLAISVAILAKPQIACANTSVYSVQRIAGNDRIDTSISASNKGWSSADTVILDELSDYPDAIAATPLAVKLDAPILLTKGTALDSRVISEMQRLKAKKVILLGGTGCLTSAIETKLKELKLPYERIGGYDRYETSTLIALQLQSDSVIVAYGDDFPDALASASFAGIRQIPIVLINKTLPQSVANYFKTQKPSNVIVVGGEAVVPTGLLSSKGIVIEKRLGGIDLYDTSAIIYDYSKTSYTSPDIFIASGEDFPDAMVGTVVASKSKAPLLITRTNTIPTPIYSILTSRINQSCGVVYILGGTSVVSADNSNSIVSIKAAEPVTTPPNTIQQVGTVTANPSLNLRETAVATSAILATIPNNAQVDVISKNASNWYNVMYKGQTGWVSGAYLVVVVEGTPPVGTPPVVTPPVVTPPVVTPPVVTPVATKLVAIVTANPCLNLRQSAVATSVVLTTIPNNVQVDVISKNATNWYNVTYNGKTGWISGAYVTTKTVPVVVVLPGAIPSLVGKVIAVDAGHGSPDVGAVGPNGTLEKDNTLAIANMLAIALRAGGATVVMTRTSDNAPTSTNFDTGTDLMNRVATANNAKADLFVSIHNDSFDNTSASGTTTYYNSSNAKAVLSSQLAADVQYELIKALGTTNRGVKDANFYVIKYTTMPAILVEAGFISNEVEEQKLSTSTFRQSIANAIMKGMVTYFNQQ